MYLMNLYSFISKKIIKNIKKVKKNIKKIKQIKEKYNI